MASLVENATRITNALDDIKAAIIAKGQTPTGRCETYADAISKISGGGSDVKVFTQKYTMGSQESITVDCGFRPKFVWFGKNAQGTPLISCYYNEETSATQYLQATGGTMRWIALGSGAPSIDITATGCVVKNSTNANANMMVVAIG